MNHKNDLKSQKSSDVSFRYLSIPYGDAEIGGFALWYQSKNDAEISVEKFRDYLEVSTHKVIEVSFNKETSITYRLKMRIIVDSEIRLIEITKIASEEVRKIKKSLGNFQYYIITVGYSGVDGKPCLFPFEEFIFFKQDIFIDGKLVKGRNVRRWPVEIFQTSSISLTENK